MICTPQGAQGSELWLHSVYYLICFQAVKCCMFITLSRGGATCHQLFIFLLSEKRKSILSAPSNLSSKTLGVPYLKVCEHWQFDSVREIRTDSCGAHFPSHLFPEVWQHLNLLPPDRWHRFFFYARHLHWKRVRKQIFLNCNFTNCIPLLVVHCIKNIGEVFIQGS